MSEEPIVNETVVEENISVEPTEKQPVEKRRGRIRYAAPLGFCVLLLAFIGCISLIVSAVQGIIRLNDDTPLREELYTFLEPVMQFCPSDFDSVETAEDSDSLLLAAAYRVTEAERIRQLREKDENCTYPLEETLYRMIIPQTVIETSYASLFGTAPLTHRTVGDVEYVADKQSYYIPMTLNTSGYTPVLGKIKKKQGIYTVKVAYVSNNDIEVDERGNAIPPTEKMAKYSQWYTLVRTDNESGFILQSVSAE